MNKGVSIPKSYWHYDKRSEKVASILLHITAEYYGLREVYQNHAGCERGYFKTKNGGLIALPKKDTKAVNLYLPDLVLYDELSNTIILVEGKRLDTLAAGIAEIEMYDSIEKEYIHKYYPNAKVERWVSIFGGSLRRLPHAKVIFYLNENGEFFINHEAPVCIRDAFSGLASL